MIYGDCGDNLTKKCRKPYPAVPSPFQLRSAAGSSSDFSAAACRALACKSLHREVTSYLRRGRFRPIGRGGMVADGWPG